MSMIHEFYAGKTEAIVSAWRARGLDKLNDQIVFAKSEWGTFFLDWADALVRVLKKDYGLRMKNFEATWDRYIFNGPKDDAFAVKIKDDFVKKIAVFSEEDLGDISKKWSASLKKGTKNEYGKNYRKRVYLYGIAELTAVLVLLFLAWRFLDPSSAWLLTVILVLAGIGLFFCNRSYLAPVSYNFSSRDLLARLKETQNICRVAIERKTDVLYYFSL